MKVILALPAYNEAAALPVLLAAFADAMRSAGFASTVVVVDDGSTDQTREVLAKWALALDIDIVVHQRNQGLGRTIRDALNRAAKLAEAADVIVTMDADNTHPPALIPAMIGRIQAGDDTVIASRYRHGARVLGLSPLRHLMSYGARILFTAVFPVRGLRDYTCAFRAYRPAVLQRALVIYGDRLVTEQGFSSMAEILLKLSRLGFKIGEVPLVLDYRRKPGSSKMRISRTVLSTLKLVVRLRFAGSPAQPSQSRAGNGR